VTVIAEASGLGELTIYDDEPGCWRPRHKCPRSST
jgi:hypothetical protein